VHALGEEVVMSISYMGGVHGDVKLAIQDSRGNMMNEWTFNHASSDPFQQSVSYTPTSPGTYTIQAMHQPHHMEPRASSSARVAVWSAKVTGLEFGNSVDIGKPTTVTSAVSYYFTQPTQVRLELWSNSENKNLGTMSQTLKGQGTTTITMDNVVFSSAQSQNVTAQILYQMPNGRWANDASGSTYTGKVTVVPEFAVAPTILLVAALLSFGLLRKHVGRRA